MPHGGGHSGGGGHHHGGFHHHHGGYHHHHHHHHHGGVVYTSHYGTAGRCFWWGFVGFMVVGAVVTVIALSVRYGGEGSEENNYTPGDTRLHTISTFFCNSVKIKMAADSSQQGYVNLYLLDEKPSLTAINSFSISNPSFTLSEYYYEYWHFYLYPNSNFSVNACVSSGSSSYYFYIIKGSGSFHNWQDVPSSYYEQSLYVSSICGNGNSTLSYTTSKEGHYYFAYYCESSSCAGQMEIFLQRFEYSLGNKTGFDNCTTTLLSDPCSLDVAYQSGYNQALVTVSETPPPGTNWEQQFTVDFSCGARAEAYLAVVLPPVFLVVLILAGVGLGYYLYKRSKKVAYNPLVEPATAPSSSSAISPPESEKVSYKGVLEAERPPPYNPQEQPPPYQ